jgi:hypothetical protein
MMTRKKRRTTKKLDQKAAELAAFFVK